MKFVILFTQNQGCRFSPITSVEFYDYSAIITFLGMCCQGDR